MKFVISLSLLALSLNISCGQASTENPAAAQLASDAELSEAGMSANLQDAMDAMSDSNSSGEGALLLSRLTADNLLDLTRSCKAEGGKAIVDLSAQLEAEKTVGGRNNSVNFSWKSSFELERTWSKDGAEIGCGLDGKFANIDLLADQNGLKADVTFTRDVSASHTITNIKNNTSKTAARTFKAVGTRAIQFGERVVNSDLSVSSQVTVKSEVKRTMTITKKNGVEATIELLLATDASAPLLVESKRASALASKVMERTLKSGKLIAETEGQGKVESVFEDLKMSFDDDSCQPESGKATMSVFAEGSVEASLIYEIKAEAGAYVVTNITDPANPVEVDDFAIQACDLRDFAY